MIRVGRTKSAGLTVYLTEEDAERLGGLRAGVSLTVLKLDDGSLLLRVEKGEGARILQNQSNLLYPFRIQSPRLRQDSPTALEVMKLDDVPEFGLTGFECAFEDGGISAILKSVEKARKPKQYVRGSKKMGAVARAEDLPYRERLKAAVAAMNEAIESAPDNVVIEFHDVSQYQGDGVPYSRAKKESRVKARIVITEEF